MIFAVCSTLLFGIIKLQLVRWWTNIQFEDNKMRQRYRSRRSTCEIWHQNTNKSNTGTLIWKWWFQILPWFRRIILDRDNFNQIHTQRYYIFQNLVTLACSLLHGKCNKTKGTMVPYFAYISDNLRDITSSPKNRNLFHKTAEAFLMNYYDSNGHESTFSQNGTGTKVSFANHFSTCCTRQDSTILWHREKHKTETKRKQNPTVKPDKTISQCEQ